MIRTGRYEFHGVTDKGGSSSKFWELKQTDEDIFEASWGRCGKAPQGYKEYTRSEVIKVIGKKQDKGYELVA